MAKKKSIEMGEWLKERKGWEKLKYAYKIRAKYLWKGRCWIYNKETLFVEQLSTAGHLIDGRVGGICLELEKRSIFSKMKARK